MALVTDAMSGVRAALVAVTDPGDPVYITGAGGLDATDGAGANTLFGHALATKGAGDGVITVKLAKV